MVGRALGTMGAPVVSQSVLPRYPAQDVALGFRCGPARSSLELGITSPRRGISRTYPGGSVLA